MSGALVKWLRGLGGIAVLFGLSLAPLCADAASLAQPAPDEKAVRIAFVGDSMVDGIWGGFVRLTGADACLKAQVELGRFGENGTGLSREDRFDWPANMAKIRASFKPDLVIVSLGLNDRQSLVDAAHVRTDIAAPNYNEHYGVQVKALLDAAVADGAGVLWIGLPILRDRAADQDAKSKSEVVRSVIKAYNKPTVDYIAPWRMNPIGEDVFAANGPSVSGGLVSLRASDGVHFTGAGYDRIAAYLLPQVIAHLRGRGFPMKDSCTKG